MDITSVHKYIALNKLANGVVEVLFAGQPCVSVSEGMMGSIWKINPVFAKLVYGANIFEDIPVCMEGHDTTEQAIAAGLMKLHELGAFRTEVDLPEDSYAATMQAIEEDVNTYCLKNTETLLEAYTKSKFIMTCVSENTFQENFLIEDRSEYTANIKLSKDQPITAQKKKFILKTPKGSHVSSHDTENDAIKAFKGAPNNTGMKIVRESAIKKDAKFNPSKS